MSPMVLQFVLAALQALPSVLAAGAEVSTAVGQITASLKAMQAENRDPSAAEWAALNAQLLAALAGLQKA